MFCFVSLNGLLISILLEHDLGSINLIESSSTVLDRLVSWSIMVFCWT